MLQGKLYVYIMFQDPIHCVCVHPTLEIAAIGMQTGKWCVIDLNTQSIIHVSGDGKEQEECMEFSPGITYRDLLYTSSFV